MALDDDLTDDVASIVGYCSDTIPDLYGQVSDGDVVSALHDLWGTITGNDEFQTVVFDLLRGIFLRLGVERGHIGEASNRRPAT